MYCVTTLSINFVFGKVIFLLLGFGVRCECADIWYVLCLPCRAWFCWFTFGMHLICPTSQIVDYVVGALLYLEVNVVKKIFYSIYLIACMSYWWWALFAPGQRLPGFAIVGGYEE